jgi:serine/threonine protein phosphatase PrpC
MKRWLRYGGASLKGLYDENKDAWTIIGHQASQKGVIFIVCDGVSVTPEGKWAAECTCKTLTEYYRKSDKISSQGLSQSIIEANWLVRGQGRGVAACTVTLGWIFEDILHIIYVGDSPAFHIHNGAVSKMTLARQTGPLRSYIGMGPLITEHIKVEQTKLIDGDWVVLASDGVGDFLSLPTLIEQCKESPLYLNEFAISVITGTQELNNEDDATVMILNYRVGESIDSSIEPIFVLK